MEFTIRKFHTAIAGQSKKIILLFFQLQIFLTYPLFFFKTKHIMGNFEKFA